MATVITNRQGTYFANVNSAGQLEVSTTGGGTVSSGTQGWDGSAWQDIGATLITGVYALDVNVAGGAISIDPGDIRIGAVELQDHNTTVRARVPLVDTSESYVAGTDAGLLTAWIDENGDFNYPIVDSTSHSLRTVTYGSVAFDNTNNLFRNQLFGWNADDSAIQDLNVIRTNWLEPTTSLETGIPIVGWTWDNWWSTFYIDDFSAGVVTSIAGHNSVKFTDADDWGTDPSGVYTPVALYTNSLMWGWDGGRFQMLTVDSSNNLKVTYVSNSSLYNGQTNVATAGTPVPLSATPQPIMKVTVKANSGNTGNIYVGGSSVASTNGLILEPGESTPVEINDLTRVYIDADTNGEGISWIAA